MEDRAEHFLKAIRRTGLDPDGETIVFFKRTTAVCTARLARIGPDAVEMVSLMPARGSDGAARFALSLICLHADVFDVRIAVDVDPEADGHGGLALRRRFEEHGFLGAAGSPTMARLPCSLHRSVAA